MTESEIMRALECAYLWQTTDVRTYKGIPIEEFSKAVLDLINRKNAEIERLAKEVDRLSQVVLYHDGQIADARAEAIKEVFAKVDETLKRYSHLHKRAEKAMRSTEEYADGMPMEMVSVWEVLSLKKWEMADYENMAQLQDNIEDIAKARMLAEMEKDFCLLAKEMGVEV